MDFKEYWRKNSRIVLIALIILAVVGFAAPALFGGSFSDSWIWLAIVGFVGLVMLIGSIIDYNKNHR